MTMKLHQITVGATPGDAITDHALMIRRWLREAGYESDLFAEFIHPALEKEVRSALTYRPGRDEAALIFHHSTGSAVAERLMALSLPLILVYHNITPPEFFASVHPALAQEMEWGLRQLLELGPRTTLALGVSPFNEAALQAAGFAWTGVLPLALDEAQRALPWDDGFAARVGQEGPLLLFVGRLVPNKKIEDLIKLLYHYRRIAPTARLLLVGVRWLEEYGRWLEDLAQDLGVREAVIFAGHVSEREMVTAYRMADLYVSMSEHEGFGKPLIESMMFDLPVLAYAAAGVPYTLGGAGVLLHAKHYEAAAEAAHLLVTDPVLRERVIAGQRRRVQDFLEPRVRHGLLDNLERCFATAGGAHGVPQNSVELEKPIRK